MQESAYWDIVSAFGGLIIAALIFADELGNRFTFFKALKSLIFKFPFFILGAFLIVMATFYKNDALKKEAEGQKISDELINKRRFDSTNNLYEQNISKNTKRLIDAFGDAIGKYKLHYDSATASLQNMIKDSVPKPLDIPHLVICGEPKTTCQKLSTNTFLFNFRLCNSEYLAKEVFAQVIWLVVKNNRSIIFRTDTMFRNHKNIAANGITNSQISIEFLKIIPDSVFCYLDMKYFNSSSKLLSNNQIMCWDLKTQKSVSYYDDDENSILQYLRKNRMVKN